MKIYTEIVIDMTTMKTVVEKSYEYDGPMAMCGKSGGGGGVDKEYNSRMASVYEKQLGMSEGLYNFYKYGTFDAPAGATATGTATPAASTGTGSTSTSGGVPTGPTNTYTIGGVPGEYIDAGNGAYYSPSTGKYVDGTGKEVQPPADIAGDSTGTGTGAATPANTGKYGAPIKGTGPGGQITLADYQRQNASMSNMELMQTRANMDLIPWLSKLAVGQAKWDLGLMPKIGAAKMEAYKLAMRNNEGSAMGEASAEVSQAYKNRSDQLFDALRRTGSTPGSGAQAGMMEDLRFDRTKAIAGARTAARNTSRATQYSQLSDFYKTA